MKIRFESDDDLPLGKILNILAMVIAGSVFSRREQVLSTSSFTWMCVKICGQIIESMHSVIGHIFYEKHFFLLSLKQKFIRYIIETY